MAGDASGPAVGTGPVPFTSDDGRYFLIPLSAVSFDANGKATLDNWPLYNTYKAALDLFLPRLLSAGVIQKGPVPPAKPALKATAVTAGASGVAVEMNFANVTPNAGTPPSSTADVTVTETRHLYRHPTLQAGRDHRQRRQWRDAAGPGLRLGRGAHRDASERHL